MIIDNCKPAIFHTNDFKKNVYRSNFWVFNTCISNYFPPDCMFFFFKVGSIFLGDQLKLHLLLDSYEITRDSEIVVPMIRSSCHVWPCCTYHCLPGMTLKPSGSLVLPVHCVSYMDKINMSGPMFFLDLYYCGLLSGLRNRSGI